MQGNATSFWGQGFGFRPSIQGEQGMHEGGAKNRVRSYTQSRFTRCLNYLSKRSYILGVIVKCCGVWDVRANKSRVHTIILTQGWKKSTA